MARRNQLIPRWLWRMFYRPGGASWRSMRLFGWEVRLAREDYWDQCVDMGLDFNVFICREIEALLKHCGPPNSGGTAPMFYPEAIASMIAHQRDLARQEAETLAATEKE